LVKGKWAIVIGDKPCYDGYNNRTALIEKRRRCSEASGKGFSIGAEKNKIKARNQLPSYYK
jgi:hypothetical protein